jgi:hypothetical protein
MLPIHESGPPPMTARRSGRPNLFRNRIVAPQAQKIADPSVGGVRGF